MTKFTYVYPIIATFLWIGFVGAISFMEAWMKFRAPGITVPLGLGIGRLVFNALNKVEIVLAITILAALLISNTNLLSFQNLFLAIPVAILLVQSWYMLPELDARAQMHINGWVVPPSNLHFQYVAIEFVKVFSLIVYGIGQFK
jgi:uncharacterized membrane protein (DUF485 family)